jgi:hypothetical protein
VQIKSLQDKTCNCKEGPVLVGQGTADIPFELEYANEVVLTGGKGSLTQQIHCGYIVIF